MIPQTILANAEQAVEALTPTSDTGAPSAFKALDSDDELEESGQDRNFVVLLDESDPDGMRDVTSATAAGTGDFRLRFVVVVKYDNEGRSRRASDAIIAQDRRRIIDYVPRYVRAGTGTAYASGTSVGECVHEGGSLDRHPDNPRIVYSRLRFIAEYNDDIVTS